eukprot:6179301-Pleurochrysis_carterae.AAC.5
MSTVCVGVLSGTVTGWKRRSSAASFSMYLRYSATVVAPMHCAETRSRQVDYQAFVPMSRQAVAMPCTAAKCAWLGSPHPTISMCSFRQAIGRGDSGAQVSTPVEWICLLVLSTQHAARRPWLRMREQDGCCGEMRPACSVPRASAGLSRLAASMAPSAAPAPTSV